MIHMIITAGGTVEDIDEVRKITNTSTGQLGTFLCDEAIRYMSQNEIEDFQIHYIVTTTAIKPELDTIGLDHVEIYEVTDTDSVLKTVQEINERYKINYFIHSMAVSDFTTDQITTVEDLTDEIMAKLKGLNEEQWQQAIETVLKQPSHIIRKDKKVSSDNDLVITLKRTVKIISTLKEQNPELFLVGFKLLKNVTEEELLNAGKQLADKNHCNLVFANDLQTISEGNHTGILIRNGEIIGRYEGKRNIARAVIYQMMKGV